MMLEAEATMMRARFPDSSSIYLTSFKQSLLPLARYIALRRGVAWWGVMVDLLARLALV